MTKTCPNCKSSEFDVDPARGDTVCMNCGSVLEENRIVSEISIQENADGSSSVVGQFVTTEGSYNPHLSGFQYGIGKESRQITLDKGKNQIRDMAAQLNLNRHCVDTAFNFFKMAISKRLSRGRRITHIVAACLYMTCRTEGTPHLLLDFSDITQVNVFILGKVFLLLAKELHINLPVLDPCMYITRFAHRLDFNEKTHEVSVAAMRLVSRMKRDWIHTGRRPSGLCGAALLVAARLHGFNCDLNDVVKVARIGHDTIRKRLNEFESTPSSKLTINEFMKIDLEAEHDPPAFINSRIKAKIHQLEAEGASLENEIGKLSNVIDDKLTQQSSRPASPANVSKPSNSSVNRVPEHVSNDDDPELRAAATFMHSEHPEAVAQSLLSPKRGLPQPTRQGFRSTGPTPTAASLGLRTSIDECLSTPSDSDRLHENDNNNGELDLTGIDDNEIDKLLLSPHESEIKQRIWMKEYGEFVKELEEKREIKRIENEKKNRRPRKFKQVRYKEYYGESRTAGEAIEKLVSRQRLSNKINYEALKKATEDCSKPESPKPDVIVSPEAIIETGDVRPVSKRCATEGKTGSRKKAKREVACTGIGVDDVVKQDVIVEETKPVLLAPEEEEEEYEEEEEEGAHCMSASQMMQEAGLAGGGYGNYGGTGYDYD
uniref:transcription factor IIIB 90 kDa subunit isoform X1 n=1 Tax=Ciona intestinalis TaxID=7719 RepID=UPI00006A4E16|nr:transcription factor IIIB 90 kDa subunit isoform X1 [Ciona intestinalis]|eukprot:XP_002130866.1 transcription factor IIIB 90 kDa subunit isoform X1 [Ciona intestinalis]